MIHIERLVVALLAGSLLAATPEAQAQTRTQTPAQSPWQNTARPAAAAQGAQPSSAAPKPQLSVADRAAQIEERLIDLQVRIATMRSLAANGAPAATGTAPQNRFQDAPLPDTQQIAALEGEVRVLSAQSSKLSGRPALIVPESTNARRPLPDNRTPSAVARAAQPSPGGGDAAPGWASSTTVSPNNNQALFAPPSQSGAAPQGELLPGTVYPGTAQPPPQTPAPQGGAVAGLANPAPLPGGVRTAPVTDGPETEYQTAYGYLLQQDYGAAQTAFREFIARHPKTPLAGNAQYWLGETHYVRGAYKDAAVAFLKGYEKYGDGNKGPDSLLKLALSLGKLRQNAAACSSLSELGTRFPNAPQGLLSRATAEKRRLRCPA